MISKTLKINWTIIGDCTCLCNPQDYEDKKCYICDDSGSIIEEFADIPNLTNLIKDIYKEKGRVRTSDQYKNRELLSWINNDLSNFKAITIKGINYVTGVFAP